MKKYILMLLFLGSFNAFDLNGKNKLMSLFFGDSDELFEKIEEENIDEAIALLKKHPAWIEQKNKWGATPLLKAANYGKKEFVENFIHLLDDPCQKDNHDWTVLDYAVAQGWSFIVSKITEKHRDDVFVNNKEILFSAIKKAAEYDKREILAYLIAYAKGIDEEYTRQHLPMADAHTRYVVKLLLKEGGVPNVVLSEKQHRLYEEQIDKLERKTCSGIIQAIFGYTKQCKKYKKLLQEFKEKLNQDAK